MRLSDPGAAALRTLLVALFCSVPLAAQGPTLATELVVDGLDRPVYLTSPPDDPRLFLLEQMSGLVRIVENGALLPTPFLDLSGLITPGGERGLLGLAFPADHATSRRFYVFYNNLDGDTELARYRADPDDPNRALPASAEVLLSLAQPFIQHNGGSLAFGPLDDMLYLATGDGGSGGDPYGNGQALDSLLGKVLRIDVRGPSGYAVPPDNPFVGVPGARPEIWHYGLRNPWRFSFDRRFGDLYIGDVGGVQREEVNVQDAGGPAGQNYGWVCKEGSLELDPACVAATPGLVDPVVEYGHNDGCAVIGGYAYRGDAMPGLAGTYFYADYCTGRVWSFELVGGQATNHVERTAELDPPGGSLGLISSFGEDAEGELYIVSHISGELYKIVPDPNEADCDGDGVPDVQELAQGTAFDVNGNGTPDDCELTLTISDLVPGQIASFDFIGALPGQPVIFFFTARNAGAGPCFFPGVCMDILPMNIPGQGISLPIATILLADAQGRAGFSGVLPPLPDVTLWFQNLAYGGPFFSVTSNVVQREIVN